jgi:hypothetical protein
MPCVRHGFIVLLYEIKILRSKKMTKDNKISSSGKHDLPKTPAGSTSPIHQERIVPQENANGELHLTCRKDPEHNGEWRCIQDPGPVVQKVVSSLTTPPVDTPSSTSEERDSRTPGGEDVETWSRDNGESVTVRRIEYEGKVVFEPIEITPQSQPADTPPPHLKAAKLDPSVGRTQVSRLGGGSKGSCKLPGTHGRQSDQRTGGT